MTKGLEGAAKTVDCNAGQTQYNEDKHPGGDKHHGRCNCVVAVVLLSAVLLDSQVMLLFMSWLALSWSILSRREQIQTNRVAAHSDSFERMRFRRLGHHGALHSRRRRVGAFARAIAPRGFFAGWVVGWRMRMPAATSLPVATFLESLL